MTLWCGTGRNTCVCWCAYTRSDFLILAVACVHQNLLFMRLCTIFLSSLSVPHEEGSFSLSSSIKIRDMDVARSGEAFHFSFWCPRMTAIEASSCVRCSRRCAATMPRSFRTMALESSLFMSRAGDYLSEPDIRNLKLAAKILHPPCCTLHPASLHPPSSIPHPDIQDAVSGMFDVLSEAALWSSPDLEREEK